MELKHLEFFVTCAEVSSFRMAANLLYTTQSNVSKVIKALEDELGVTLFERSQSGISLTDKGKRIYDYAVNTLESAHKISNYAGETTREELRILTNPSPWLAGCFSRYYTFEGKNTVTYHVMTAATDEIIRRVSEGIDDMGFAYVMQAQLPMLKIKLKRNHLTFQTLKQTKAVLYLGQKNEAVKADVKAEDIDPKELGEIALVQGYEDEYTLKTFWNREMNTELGRDGHRVAVFTNSDYLTTELLANTDLGNISAGYLSHSSRAPQNPAISLYGEEDPVEFGVIIPDNRLLQKNARDFLRFVEQDLKEE